MHSFLTFFVLTCDGRSGLLACNKKNLANHLLSVASAAFPFSIAFPFSLLSLLLSLAPAFFPGVWVDVYFGGSRESSTRNTFSSGNYCFEALPLGLSYPHPRETREIRLSSIPQPCLRPEKCECSSSERWSSTNN